MEEFEKYFNQLSSDNLQNEELEEKGKVLLKQDWSPKEVYFPAIEFMKKKIFNETTTKFLLNFWIEFFNRLPKRLWEKFLPDIFSLFRLTLFPKSLEVLEYLVKDYPQELQSLFEKELSHNFNSNPNPTSYKGITKTFKPHWQSEEMELCPNLFFLYYLNKALPSDLDPQLMFQISSKWLFQFRPLLEEQLQFLNYIIENVSFEKYSPNLIESVDILLPHWLMRMANEEDEKLRIKIFQSLNLFFSKLDEEWRFCLFERIFSDLLQIRHFPLMTAWVDLFKQQLQASKLTFNPIIYEFVKKLCFIDKETEVEEMGEKYYAQVLNLIFWLVKEKHLDSIQIRTFEVIFIEPLSKKKSLLLQFQLEEFKKFIEIIKEQDYE